MISTADERFVWHPGEIEFETDTENSLASPQSENGERFVWQRGGIEWDETYNSYFAVGSGLPIGG